MSGTSLDGIDVALIVSDGEKINEIGPFRSFFYAEGERELLRRALKDAAGMKSRDELPGVLNEAKRTVTVRHAEAVEVFLAETGTARSGIDLVGFHGQTVLHDPARRLTVQIGDGAALAGRLGIPVVWDFRAADVGAGGQGAPFVPAYHRALAETAGLEPPVAFLNVGGVANVTYIGADGELIAFDTGPGNALLDDWVHRRTGSPFDADGRLAASGKPSERFLAQLLAQPYFYAPPPKSLDRNSFDVSAVAELSDADGAATLLAFTARSVAAALRHLPALPRSWHVCGGGRRNAALMRLLGEMLKDAPIRSIDELGFDGDATEAQAFGFLAIRAADGAPLTFPMTTGVPAPLSGGRISLPASTG
jgi:anhydro-N-acetylmuramic acid kinase